MLRRIAWLLGFAVSAAVAQPAVPVYAAGSLRGALVEAARAFEAAPGGARTELVFGASGLLRERIVQGEAAQVFASANMEHPRALAAAGGWTPVRVFTRNALCAIAPARLELVPERLVERLLDPQIKVGTSTPRADPSGDYAFEMFARIAAQPGAPADARARLEAKALQLTGGPTSPPPPAGRNVYGALVAQGAADIFLTYCTNAVVAVAENPQLRWLAVPDAINVGADYGLTLRNGAPAAAEGFAAFLLSAPGQAILARHGFLAPVR